MCIFTLRLAFFLIGCSENNEPTAPKTAINQEKTDYYLHIYADVEEPPFNAMPFDGYCDVYKSTDQIHWATLTPFSWRYGGVGSGMYLLETDTYYKWQGHNLGEPNDWETTTQWYYYYQDGNPNDNVQQCCMFYKD